MTWLQIIDDAVKIGLGGLIGGAFAWLVARHTNQSAMQRLRFERRSKVLSEVAEQFEAYFQAYLELSGHISAMIDALSQTPNNTAGKIVQAEAEPKMTTRAMELHLQLAERIQSGLAGQAQLMLLGEQQCLEKARLLHEAIQVAQDNCPVDWRKCDPSKLHEAAVGVRNARIAFYESMRSAFDKA